MLRHHESANDGGHDPADGPERLQQHNHPPADLARGEFTHQRGGHRQLRAQAQPDEEAEHHEGSHGPCERGRAGGEAVKQERGREPLASSDLVCQETAE